jgi:diguanylate cyclase (GGDEF)-like protein
VVEWGPDIVHRAMSDLSAEPGWLRWLRRLVRRSGAVRVTASLVVLACVASVGLALGIAALAGVEGRGTIALAAGLGALALAPAVGALLVRLVVELERANSQIGVMATQDELTGVANRRHFIYTAEREMARCRRYDTDGAVLLIDADHFRRINDTHGHLAGDALLREMARAAGRSLRQPDVLARFGGEELAIFLPHTDPLGALDVAERVREQVGALRLVWQGRKVGTTVSIGVAALGSGHATLDALLRDADAALREAKQAGRNCVRAAPIQPRRSGETRPVTSR